MNTLNFPASKRIHELMGASYETHWYWFKSERASRKKCSGKNHPIEHHGWILIPREERNNKQGIGGQWKEYLEKEMLIPAPDFSEAIRATRSIRSLEDFATRYAVVARMAEIYMGAETPQQGMEEVSQYLLKYLG